MNKRVILGALMIICSAGILTPVGLAIIFWEYVKKAIKIDFYTIYLLIRFVVWLFIQLPLGVLKVSTHGISSTFHTGISAVTEKPMLSGTIFLGSMAFLSFIFTPSLISASNLGLGTILGSLQSFVFILFGAAALTIIIDTLIMELSGGDIAKVNPMDTGMAGAAQNLRGEAASVKESRGAFRDLESPESIGGEIEDVLEFWEQPDVKSIFGELGELLPGVGSGSQAAKSEATREAAKYGAEATEAAEGASLGPIFLVMIIFLIAQWLLVMVIIGSYVQLILPAIAGPVTGALGLGSDYGSYFAGSTADSVAGTEVFLQDEVGAVMEARQRVYCLLQGPACLRQWRLNNTRNPGSESVGEEYKLQIDRLEIGSGEELDVAYKNGGYKLPVSFGLSNARNGLKGINAYDVKYRLRMIDSNRNLQDPYCDTGWSPINGYNIRNSDNGEVSGNDLYPGTAANTGFLTLDDFSLENCGLLQPGSGETKTVVLEVKYDYFSQATLYFDAMARQTLLSDSSIQKEWKQSETADTPVKSAINVNSPVIYNQDALTEPNREAAQPFSMRAELYTEEDTVEYKINSLKVRKSSEVGIREGSEQRCMFEPGNSEDILVPGNSAGDIIAGEVSDNSDQPQDDPEGMLRERDPGSSGPETDSSSENEERWFSSSAPAPFFGCTMTLTNPRDISPGGETLTMGVQSNYTVKLSEQLERFDVLNSRCTEFNCPLLVTKQFADGHDSGNWRYKCEGPDAAARSGPQAGCAAVKGDPTDWSTIELLTGENKLDKRIERREIAIDPADTKHISNVDYSAEEVAIGLTEDEFERLENDYYISPQDDRYGYVLISQVSGEKDTVLEGIEKSICDSAPKSAIADQFSIERNQIVGYETASCQSGN